MAMGSITPDLGVDIVLYRLPHISKTSKHKVNFGSKARVPLQKEITGANTETCQMEVSGLALILSVEGERRQIAC